MPPVNSAPTSEVDNEATAELPVLDVAAYEATLEGEEPLSHTDTWALPSSTFVPAPHNVEATAEMPAVKPAYDLDHSGTHEMPQMPLPQDKGRDKAAKHRKHAAASNNPKAKSNDKGESAETAAVVHAPAPIVVPPSPPLIEELRGALAGAERRIEELHERARIADAERTAAIDRANAECVQLRAQLTEYLEALASAKERRDVQRKDQAELLDSFNTRGDRIAELEKQLAAQDVLLTQVRGQLMASERRAEILDCDGQNLRATVARRNSQISMLEADMAARNQREIALKARLDEAVASIEPNVPRLHADIAAREEKLREMKADLDRLRTQNQEKDADLQVAEESIRQLENELSDKTSKLTEASVTVEEWRAVIAESQRSILQRDNRIQQLESDIEKRASSYAVSIDHTGEEIALEGPARVLIRTDGNTDFVHVLGRRTRIGRGSDNEIVLDTKHVSRYHAVLLAGPVHTSIEDLNSTNGVFVNNKRVTRQILKEGDKVMIGKSQFRYTVRD